MRKLKGSERTYLRGLAHKLKPVIQVGKSGITEELLAAVNEALDAHELIKIKFGDFKDQKAELSEMIATKTTSQIIGAIGNIIMVYREHPELEKRKIKLP